MSAPVYERWAAVLDYPGEGFAQAIEQAPAAAAPFVAFARTQEISDLEELYARTFDINPVCCLETGWQLFGEDYKRGAFLVEMRRRMREAGIPEGTELPDHLCNALRLLAKLPADETDLFVCHFVLPAVERMLAGFAEKQHAYRGLMEALAATLRRVHGEAVPPDPPKPALDCSTTCALHAAPPSPAEKES